MMPKGFYNRDHYIRKMQKHEQEYLNDLADRKRFSKEERRSISRKKDKDQQHLEGLSSFINEQLNPYVFNNKYSLYSIRSGKKILVADWATNLETIYVPLYTAPIDTEHSITRALSEVTDLEKKYECHFKRDYITVPDPEWYETNSPFSPQLNLKEGGFTSHGSWRNQDHLDCLLTRNEFVVTAPAVRGLGKGSYELGATILHYLVHLYILQQHQSPTF